MKKSSLDVFHEMKIFHENITNVIFQSLKMALFFHMYENVFKGIKNVNDFNQGHSKCKRLKKIKNVIDYKWKSPM